MVRGCAELLLVDAQRLVQDLFFHAEEVGGDGFVSCRKSSCRIWYVLTVPEMDIPCSAALKSR